MSSNQPEQLFWALRWTLRDVVALVVTAIILGLVFYLWGWAMQLLSRVLGDVVAGLFYGVWFWAGLLLAYAIRKPGAALLGQFSAALVAYALGSPLGVLILVFGWVQGLALEVVFAWARFQHWGLVTMLVAGAVAGTASFAVNLAVDRGVSLAVDVAVARGVNLVAPPWLIYPQPAGIIIAILCIAVISGAVLGGLVCKILGDRFLAIAPVRQFLGKQVSQVS